MNEHESNTALSEKDKKFREFALTGNLWKVIFYVCIPLSVFQLINHLFNILDTMMASHVSAMAVSAVAYLSQLQNMISAVGTGLAVGSTLKISEAYGAGDYALVKKRLSTLLTICAIIAGAVLLMIPFTPVLLYAGNYFKTNHYRHIYLWIACRYYNDCCCQCNFTRLSADYGTS